MDHPLDDAAALAGARRGDAEAFGALVERYQQVAFRAAYLSVRDAATAEDVAQQGFVRAYLNLRRFREGDSFRPWLLRIVTSLARNELRARGRRQGLLARAFRLAPPSEQGEPGPERAAEKGERRQLLLSAINELPLDDRVALTLAVEAACTAVAEFFGLIEGVRIEILPPADEATPTPAPTASPASIATAAPTATTTATAATASPRRPRCSTISPTR